MLLINGEFNAKAHHQYKNQKTNAETRRRKERRGTDY